LNQAYAREVRGSENSFVVEDPDDANKPESERMRYEFEISIEGEAGEEEEVAEADDEDANEEN